MTSTVFWPSLAPALSPPLAAPVSVVTSSLLAGETAAELAAGAPSLTHVPSSLLPALPVAPVAGVTLVVALVVGTELVAEGPDVTGAGGVDGALAGGAAGALPEADVVASAPVAAAGAELPGEHAAATNAAAKTGRRETSRNTTTYGFGFTVGVFSSRDSFESRCQTRPVKLPAKSSPNSVASTPNMLRNVVYSLLCGSF